MVAVFEVGWREVAEGGMAALAVVEDLDVLEDSGSGLLPGGPGLAVQQLGVEGGEEALSDRVVPARAGMADALAQVVSSQPVGVGTGQILPGFKGSSQHRLPDVRIGNRSGLRPGSSTRAPCAAGR